MQNPENVQQNLGNINETGTVFPGMEYIRGAEQHFRTNHSENNDCRYEYRNSIISILNNYLGMVETRPATIYYNNGKIRKNLDKSTFITLFNKYKFLDPEQDPKKVYNVKLSKFWLENYKSYEGFCFSEKTIPGYLNTFDKSELKTPCEGNVEPVLNHIKYIWCKNNPEVFIYVISWLAFCVQYPFIKIGVALVVLGEQGSGKGIIMRLISDYFGKYFKTLRSTEAFGRFNSAIEDALFILFDEAYFSRSGDQRSNMKRLITETKLSVEEKGFESRQIESCCNVAIFTNDIRACGAETGDRRHIVLETDNKYAGPQTKEIKEYMDLILNVKSEHFIHFLLNYDISKFNPREFPNTKARSDQIELNHTTVEAFWFETLKVSDMISDSYIDGNTGNWKGFHMKEMKNYPKNDIYKIYTQFVKNNCDKYSVTLSNSQFWKETPKLLPSLNHLRFTEFGKQMKGVNLPSLIESREIWQKNIGYIINWDD